MYLYSGLITENMSSKTNNSSLLTQYRFKEKSVNKNFIGFDATECGVSIMYVPIVPTAFLFEGEQLSSE